MKRLCATIPIALLLTACASNVPDEAESETPVRSRSATLLATFDADGHKLSIYEMSPGSVLVDEASTLGEPSVLAGIEDGLSMPELYARFNDGPAPQALIDFEARAQELASRTAETTPAAPPLELSEPEGRPQVAAPASGASAKHQAGAVHFRDAHCSTRLDPYTNRAVILSVAKKKFCWADEHIGSWTEQEVASGLTHLIQVIRGVVNYTVTSDQYSETFTFFAGEQHVLWALNRAVSTWTRVGWSCPRNSVCSSLSIPGLAVMKGTVAARPGASWRFSGAFWTPDPRAFIWEG